MSVQVARAGQVILTLESLDVLRDEVDAGRVLPTDHYIVLGMPSWRLVSTLPPVVPPPAPSEATLERVQLEHARGLIDRASAQVMELINAKPFPKPAQCKHCGGAELRSARLVWQQSTKIGGAIDTDLDITVFGTSSLQGLDVAPPPEPRMPTESSGGCLTTLVSFFVFVIVLDVIALPLIALGEYLAGGEPYSGARNFLHAAGLLVVLALAGYVAFRAARAVYRWDKRRSGNDIDGDCARQLDRARVYARWRNTWICMSCGGKTVVVG